jgi:hypothetical protein
MVVRRRGEQLWAGSSGHPPWSDPTPGGSPRRWSGGYRYPAVSLEHPDIRPVGPPGQWSTASPCLQPQRSQLPVAMPVIGGHTERHKGGGSRTCSGGCPETPARARGVSGARRRGPGDSTVEKSSPSKTAESAAIMRSISGWSRPWATATRTSAWNSAWSSHTSRMTEALLSRRPASISRTSSSSRLRLDCRSPSIDLDPTPPCVPSPDHGPIRPQWRKRTPERQTRPVDTRRM